MSWVSVMMMTFQSQKATELYAALLVNSYSVYPIPSHTAMLFTDVIIIVPSDPISYKHRLCEQSVSFHFGYTRLSWLIYCCIA